MHFGQTVSRFFTKNGNRVVTPAGNDPTLPTWEAGFLVQLEEGAIGRCSALYRLLRPHQAGYHTRIFTASKSQEQRWLYLLSLLFILVSDKPHIIGGLLSPPASGSLAVIHLYELSVLLFRWAELIRSLWWPLGDSNPPTLALVLNMRIALIDTRTDSAKGQWLRPLVEGAI